MRCVISSVLLLALLAVSLGADAGDTFNAYGVGQITCGKYIQETKNNPQARIDYSWWIAGFVTSANMGKRRWTTTDQDGLDAWIENYCTAHPLDTFMTAAMRLDAELEHHKRP